MVTLSNLIKSGNKINTDYYLENNKEDRGHVEYDVEKRKVTKYSYSQEDEKSNIKYGFKKSVVAIEKLIEADKFPEEYKYIWY